MSESINTILTLIPAGTLPTLLRADKENIFSKLYDELKDFFPDATNKKGREEIASKAHKVSKAKMDMVRLSQTLKENHQKTIKSINDEVKVVETKFDELRDRIRQPLTDFENTEKARVRSHEEAIKKIDSLSEFSAQPSIDEIQARITELENQPKLDWQEFAQRAFDAKERTALHLQGALALAEKHEREAQEDTKRAAVAAEHQRQENERLQKEREARIAEEAAEKAKMAAEIAAKVESERLHREALSAKYRAEKAEQDKISAERRAQEIAARFEREREEAERRAEQRRLDAIAEERRRAEAEKAKESADTAAREKNRAHKSRILGDAKSAIMAECGLIEADAVKIIRAVVARKIPHICVKF